MPPVGRLNFVLLLNFSVLRKIELEEKIGVKVAGSEPVKLDLLMLFDQHMYLERFEFLVQLEDHVIQGNMAFFNFLQPLFVLVVFLFLPAKVVCMQIFCKML